MLHPVGRLPARVYWRRRLIFVGLPLIGIILILWAMLSSGGGRSSARNTSSTTTKPSTTPAPATSAPRDSSSIGVSSATPTPTRTPTQTTTTSASTSTSTSASATGKGFCAADDLSVIAGTVKKSYPVKSKPVLYMQVTDVSAAPCKIDVADKYVEWRIYSGDARFWGSHDCAVEPGANPITLTPQRSVRISISWSGLTSAPKCAGTRIVAQAGTYKLYAYLNGHRSPVATFTIT